jgi:hypothetical protein
MLLVVVVGSFLATHVCPLQLATAAHLTLLASGFFKVPLRQAGRQAFANRLTTCVVRYPPPNSISLSQATRAFSNKNIYV